MVQSNGGVGGRGSGVGRKNAMRGEEMVLVYRKNAASSVDDRFSPPRDGLTAQLQRCSVSIPSNIAEGHGRDHLGEYLHHLGIANGSLMELETQVLIAARRSYISKDEAERVLALSRVVGRLLAGLVRALKLRIPRHPTPGT